MITDKTSFEFFDWLLEYDRSEELKHPYAEYFLKFNTPETYNEETGELQDWDEAFGYSNYLSLLCSQNSRAIQAIIASYWQDSEKPVTEKNAFLNRTKKKAELLKLAADKFYDNYPFVSRSLSKIIDYIEDIKFLPSESSVGLSHLSFKWIGTDEQLSQLFTLLRAAPSIIEVNQENFENAFRGREIREGIKWLKTTNRGDPLKSLLIYFINELQNLALIEKFESRELESRICYVFRSKENLQIKNVKQSKNQHIGFPIGKDLIDDILDEITK